MTYDHDLSTISVRIDRPMNWTFLDRFRRITTSGILIPEIDGLRFIAILSVVLFHIYGEFLVQMWNGLQVHDLAGTAELPAKLHSWAIPLRFIAHGAYGVQIFFAISGFILAWPFARQFRHPVHRQFQLRRRPDHAHLWPRFDCH
jgi:peptidoglycan/LPS O-acetylase OafA/YrhL